MAELDISKDSQTTESHSFGCTFENCTGDEDANISLDAEFKMTMAYVVIGCIGMCGNSVVMGVILSSSRLRKATTNVFIANQSAIDFSASLFIVLTSLIRNVHAVHGIIAKEIFCRLWMSNFPIWGLFVSSTYNLLSITLERYSAIVHPLRHGQQCSKGKARFGLVFPWVWGLGYNLAYMVPTSPYKNGQCTAYSEWPSATVQNVVGLITIFIQYFIPLVTITFAYIRIVLALRKSFNGSGRGNKANDNANSADTRNEKREQLMIRARKNVVKTLVIVSLSFVLCWSPNQIIYTMYNLGVEIDFNGEFYHFTVIAVFLNCCINPFIYALQYDQFKNVLFRRCKKGPDLEDVSGRTNFNKTLSQSGSRATSVMSANSGMNSIGNSISSVSGKMDTTQNGMKDTGSQNVLQFDNVVFESDFV